MVDDLSTISPLQLLYYHVIVFVLHEIRLCIVINLMLYCYITKISSDFDAMEQLAAYGDLIEGYRPR